MPKTTKPKTAKIHTLDPEGLSKFLVTQSNDLVSGDYSAANLTARTMKIGRLIVSKINPEDIEFKTIEVKNDLLKRYLGYKSNVPYNRFRADLRDACKKLNEEPIRIKTGPKTTLNAFLISSWEENFETDTTEFSISEKLRHHLLNLKKNYTAYQLENIPKAGSSYSIRIYELLSQYRRIGKRRFELEDFKKKIGCNYDQYKFVKLKAISKAQKELSLYTDLCFEYEKQRLVELLLL